MIKKELNSYWRRSREERMTKLRNELILLLGSFCSSRKRAANG